jgi:hypothetical protein
MKPLEMASKFSALSSFVNPNQVVKISQIFDKLTVFVDKCVENLHEFLICIRNIFRIARHPLPDNLPNFIRFLPQDSDVKIIFLS